ncbi:DUF4153 domain-containing protein [Inediibacterium massiliense]|uniref:DUF4153 domain-containing protein n=1 Tax=Inediibacterium massiliense TaxID=1658111 RepID=UPI0006B59385|nr:DUF4173 domain-containing protein [Inediibacterium massiliense]
MDHKMTFIEKRLYMESKKEECRQEKISMDQEKSINEKLRLICTAFMMAILSRYFFSGEAFGISVFLFSMCMMGMSIWALSKKVDIKNTFSYVFVIAAILLSMSFSIFNNEVLRGMNIIVIPLLITTYIYMINYGYKEISIDFFEKILYRISKESCGAINRFFPFTKEILYSKKFSKMNSNQRNILHGLVIAVPLLLVIIGLLASADMVFAYYIENMWKILGKFNIWNGIRHMIWVMIITLYLFGFLWSFQYKETLKEQKKKEEMIAWEPVTIITVIFAICIIYGLFSMIQFSYLYGGHTPKGLSYSAYARKGFFELIYVTLLNFLILIFSMKFNKKGSQKLNKVLNTSYTLLIAFTFNMLFSASYKMFLYEKEFGFTRLRIFVQAFMIFLGILFFVVFIGIWVQRVPIFKTGVIAVLSVYILLNYINVDKIVAKYNIERYENKHKIDMNYLKSLSYDATEEILRLYDVGDEEIKKEVREYEKKIVKEVKDSYDCWYEYNYYKSKIVNE